MAFTPITGQPVQYSTANNEIASGYYLKFYDVGTLNGYSVAVDSTGTPTLAKVKLNDNGYPISNPLDNSTVFIPYVDQSYRIVLYKNEADADADTTGSADWNVDGIPQDISPSADAKDITLRAVDVETQDDYDRSPLFVDGAGFTAGAGPHVITPAVVTPAWVPNNTDTRFYRLDASGIVTELTPTAKDATTFTLAETLLSTDTIFIGDDKFRNQYNGGEEVTGFTKSIVHHQTITGGSTKDLVALSADSVYETYGPTGSGATNEWTALDAIKYQAAYVDIEFTMTAKPTVVPDILSIRVRVRENSSGEVRERVNGLYSNLALVTYFCSVRVTVQAGNIFEMSWANLGTAVTGNAIDARITGYGLKYVL